ncbi:YtxH domain-containing protein [Paenibacillus rhizoplanae]
MNKAEKEFPVESGSTFFKGIFIGGLLGAAAALLFAPKPGREMRSDLSDKLTVATDKTKEVAGAVTDKTKTIATTVGEKKATDLAGTVSAKASDIFTTVSDSKQQIAATLAETGKKRLAKR